jgi:hypothetical protein
VFYLQIVTFYSGGTRIRTGGTMIFRFVPNPKFDRHRAPWAESKRFLEVTYRRGPPPNAVGRHTVVVELWWAQRVPEREEDSERSKSLEREKKGARSCLPSRTPNILRSHPGGTGPGQRANSHLDYDLRLCRIVDMDFRERGYLPEDR